MCNADDSQQTNNTTQILSCVDRTEHGCYLTAHLVRVSGYHILYIYIYKGRVR